MMLWFLWMDRDVDVREKRGIGLGLVVFGMC